MVLGIEMIQDRITTLDTFPEEIATRLHHLLLSHHGRHEFGSPVLPMIREAFVLNFLDELDSKNNYFDRLGEQAKGPEYQWTDYQKNMERFLYIKGHSDADPGSPTPSAEQTFNRAANPSSENPDNMDIDPRQATLWK
jgi:3'-5' exoribonuclease